jgi:drug/metabolite transporter superfamily protein YnfA
MNIRKSAFFTVLALLALSLFVRALPVEAQGQAGTTLTATVDVYPHWTITYGWTIDKSVTPTTWDLFSGDSGTSQYTITVTKDGGTEAAWVDGQVCVTNGGAVATENLEITAVLQDGYGPPNDFLTSALVDLSSNPVLDPGETGCYDYRVDIPITGGAFPQPHAGGTYKVTANVTITNHSGHLGELFGPSPSATTVFPSSPTLINDTIKVDDTNGDSWLFSDTGSEMYERTFTCDDNEGTHDNTATIVETEQSASASVTVNCYKLTVTKNATTTFDRDWTWTIDKSGDQTDLTLSEGQVFEWVNYTVMVDATSTDSNWAVSGKITISNLHPTRAAELTAVTDLVSSAIAATVDCGGATSVPAGQDLTCSYSASLPDAADRTNTATATLQNYDFASDGTATKKASTTDFSGSANVTFDDTPTNETDECINVSDDKYGPVGNVCASGAPKTFTYSMSVGPYDVCGMYEFVNTASFVSNDNGDTGSDSWTVSVNVPCDGGCTLTPGYWKTHSSYGPAPYDDTWAQIGEDTPFFLSGQSYYEVLWTPPQGGNAYYILAHAYIAAELNFLNGADSSAAQDSFDEATVLFEKYKPDEVAGMKGKNGKATRADFIALAEILDDYNNGLIGPGHCSEEQNIAGTDTVSMQDIEDSKAAASSVDMTGDNLVNFLDLAYVADRFGSMDAQADVNDDGIVNIVDLSWLAKQLD